MWTETGREARERRKRGLLVLGSGGQLVLLVLLCHAGPQLHAISKTDVTVRRP